MTKAIITIVGVGLIGGSVGLALRQRALADRVRGVGWRQESLDEAVRRGAIDEGTLDLYEGVSGADIVVFCTPVANMVSQILAAASTVKPGTLLTDAGSTKAVIVESIEGQLPQGVDFVGSHPLAGSEKRGPAYADANLFDGRLTIVTPTSHTSKHALERTIRFWQGLGSRVRVMSPAEHDRALAATSHLPHLVAASLASTLPAAFADLTATGFRDTTRIAAGDPGLWSGIFRQNRAAVLAALATFQQHLNQFEQALEQDDDAQLRALLEAARTARESLNEQGTP